MSERMVGDRGFVRIGTDFNYLEKADRGYDGAFVRGMTQKWDIELGARGRY